MAIRSFFKAIFMLFLITVLLPGCSTEIDNWDYPRSVVSGRFVYKGQPMQLMSTASDATGSNMLQLHQTDGDWIQGFVKVFAKEDGTFTVNAFDGDYYLTLTPGRGPWQPNMDTVRFSLNGEKRDLSFEVTPYFWISDFKDSYADSTLTATFKLEQIVPTANLERVVVELGTTVIVDNLSKAYEKSFTTITAGSHTVTLNLKELSGVEKANLRRTGHLFSRIGVKTAGVSDMIYSETVKLQ